MAENSLDRHDNMADGLDPEIGRDLDKVIARYGDMVYRLAFAYLRQKADADDIFQEVFLRYLRANPAFGGEEHRKAWLLRVTANCCKSFLGSAFRRHNAGPDELDNLPAYDDEAARDLAAALLEIPPKYRLILHLYYYEGLSTERLAAILGLKPSAIRMRLVRGRALLKQKLKGEYEYE